MTDGDDNQDAMMCYEAMKRTHSPNGAATSQNKQRGALTDG